MTIGLRQFHNYSCAGMWGTRQAQSAGKFFCRDRLFFWLYQYN